MKSILSIIMLAGLSLMVACAPASKEDTHMDATVEATADVQPVYEIAVRKVKERQKAAFVDARTAFIEVLTQQEGVSNDREFQSFYALPTPDSQEVFIGMTQYASAQTPQAVQSVPEIGAAFGNFAQTMDLKAYVYVQPIEGPDFDLGSLAKEEGRVLEVAVRRIKEDQEEAFQAARKAFVDRLSKEDGALDSWEFAVVAGANTERLAVGMTVYENMEKFQALAQGLQTWPEAAFFQYFEPIALQYAISVK